MALGSVRPLRPAPPFVVGPFFGPRWDEDFGSPEPGYGPTVTEAWPELPCACPGSGTETNFFYFSRSNDCRPHGPHSIKSPPRRHRPHQNRSTVPAPTRARWPPRPPPTSPARPSCRRSAPPRRPTIPPSSPLLRPRSVRNPRFLVTDFHPPPLPPNPKSLTPFAAPIAAVA